MKKQVGYAIVLTRDGKPGIAKGLDGKYLIYEDAESATPVADATLVGPGDTIKAVPCEILLGERDNGHRP